MNKAIITGIKLTLQPILNGLCICMFVLAGLLLTSQAAQASKVVYQFDNYSIDQGLNSQWAIEVLQDSQGFIWVATQTGLFRFDGYEFKVFLNDPKNDSTLANNYVQSIFEDNEGRMWVGTNAGVLHQYIRQTDSFIRYPFDQDYPNTVASNSHIMAINQGDNDHLWVGTLGGGLHHFDLKQQKFTQSFTHDPRAANTLSDDSIYDVLQDSQGVVWVATRSGGLNRLDVNANSFKHYKHQIGNPLSISHNKVYALIEADKGDIWVGTRGGGLNYFNRQTETFSHYRHDPNDLRSLSSDRIFSLMQDDNGVLWVGTIGGGLNRLKDNGKGFIRYQHNPGDRNSLPDNDIFSMAQDSSGLIWLATFGEGLSKFDPNSARFGRVEHQPDDINSLSKGQIHTILQDRAGILWIGSDSALDRYDPVKSKFTRYQYHADDPTSLKSNGVWSLFEDSEGTLWVGTRTEGLVRFNQNDGTFTYFKNSDSDSHSLSDNFVSIIAQDRFGALWVGTQRGLNRYNKLSKNFTRYTHDPNDPTSISHNYISHVYIADDGTLWIATIGGGINRFDYQKEQFTRYKHDADNTDSLSHNSVYAITQDSKNRFWMGTLTGLNQFNPVTGKFKVYHAKNPLISSKIQMAFSDKLGKLWLAGKGVTLFDPDTGIMKTDVAGESKCSANVGAYFQATDGKMYFGTDGYCAFYPEQAIMPSKAPTLVFTNFRLLNKSVSVATPTKPSPLTQSINTTESITLNHEENVLAFEFAALHYVQPKLNQYQYKLEGFNPDWIDTDADNRHATYTNLSAGRYTFRIRASNNAGVWTTQDKTIKLIVLPAPWHTWWAYALYGLSVMAVILAFVRVQRQKVRIERSISRQLEQKVSTRTAALEHSNQTITALSQISTEISSTLDLNVLLKTVYNHIKELMEVDVFLIGLYEPDNKQIMVKLAIECDEYMPEFACSMDQKGMPAVWCVEHQKPMIIGDYNRDFSHYFGDLPVPNPEVGGHTESVIYWPLTVSTHIIGVLSVQSFQKNAYDEHQQDMIQALASTTAIALDNARAYREVEQKSSEVEQQKVEVEENHRQIMAAQQQLVQSEKMASLGTLTAGVAHEINNPTNFVHASAHILAQDVAAFEQFLIALVGDDAEQAILDSFKQQFEPLYQHISTIQNGTERIKAIVQDLRIFTQLDSADKKLADVTDCLHSTVKLVKTQYLEVAEFVMDFQPVPQLHCYPAQLNQVFMNLIVNACDAIDEKRIRTGASAQGRIVIGCREVGKVIEITVKDNGGGMSEQTQIKLFEPFYTTKDVGKGTGLGLSISYGIVQKHQGDLVVESELGLGSMFTLTLPVM